MKYKAAATGLVLGLASTAISIILARIFLGNDLHGALPILVGAIVLVITTGAATIRRRKVNGALVAPRARR